MFEINQTSAASHFFVFDVGGAVTLRAALGLPVFPDLKELDMLEALVSE